MKFVLAPDSFKGSLSSVEVIEILTAAALVHFPGAKIASLPIADGGEGTVDALVATQKGQLHSARVRDPLGREIEAKYGTIGDRIAVIEIAQASGLPLLKLAERNPLLTTSYGTGQLIRAALDAGARELVIGIGGSATNDGGLGALQALGARFLDSRGDDLSFGGGELTRIVDFDLEGLDSRIAKSRIAVLCDVDNPLTGPNGATAVYGPQKGANPAQVAQLELGMKNWSQLIFAKLGLDVESIPGAGAAGGLGAALVAFLGAELRSGVGTILDLLDFDSAIADADLVITGEGKLDGQTIHGKVPVGVAARCQKRGVPVIAIAGMLGPDADKVYQHGISSMVAAVNRDMSITEAMEQARPLLAEAAERMFRLLKIGFGLNQ